MGFASLAQVALEVSSLSLDAPTIGPEEPHWAPLSQGGEEGALCTD